MVSNHRSTQPGLRPSQKGDGALAEIFSEIGTDRPSAARKILGWLRDNPDTTPLAAAARRLIFLKGRDAQDYKYSAAVLEDAEHLPAPTRDRLLASGAFYFKGSGDADNGLVQRTRAALGA